jgi:hypothetical protein
VCIYTGSFNIIVNAGLLSVYYLTVAGIVYSVCSYTGTFNYLSQGSWGHSATLVVAGDIQPP